jgi:formylglycine-generating enzyme required for sulfatase activity
LPTEAEWEYAARGGDQSRGYKYSGSDNAGDVAWFSDNSKSMAHPVGTKRANELGIHDMSGNVNEWVYDWYGDYDGDTQTNPTGPESGKYPYRVFRGGSWFNGAWYARVSYRNGGGARGRTGETGFRLALSSE